MNILFVVTRADAIGGVQIHVLELAQSLSQAGHLVHVVVGEGEPYIDLLKQHNIPFTQLKSLRRNINPFRDSVALVHLKRVIDKVKPDLISTHSSKAGVLGRLAARLCGTPCLFTAHGWAFTDGIAPLKRFVYRWIERILAPLADKIICVSEADRQHAIRAGIPEWRMRTIQNGRHDLTVPDQSARASSKPDVVRLVMVGRLAKQKDYSTLFRALAGLKGFELSLVGDGPMKSELEQLAQELNIANSVRFLGDRRDVAQILAASDIFCLISKWEGLPRSALEAMRAGLPVVVSDVGGCSELVRDGQSGFLVARGDETQVRDRLERLLKDAKLRRRMGAQGRALFEQQFTFGTMFAKTLEEYWTALNPLGRQLPAESRCIHKQG